MQRKWRQWVVPGAGKREWEIIVHQKKQKAQVFVIMLFLLSKHTENFFVSMYFLFTLFLCIEVGFREFPWWLIVLRIY